MRGAGKGVPLSVQLKREKMRFSAFALSGEDFDVLRAWESENCDCSDNVLQAGFGMEMVYCPTMPVQKTSEGLPENCQFFPMPGVNAIDEQTENVGALGSNGTLYTYNYLSEKWVSHYPFSSKMRALRVVWENGKEQTAFIGSAGLYFYTHGKAVQTTGMVNLGERAHLACVAQGRLFFVSAPSTLCFSKAYDPSNFIQSVEDGGQVQLPTAYGDIVDLVAFGNHVCVVYECGLSQVSIRGDATDFIVQTVEHTGGRIVHGSIGTCGSGGKTLYYLSESGIYKWSGNRVERVCKNIPILPKRTGQVCEHGFFEGKYILTYIDENRGRTCVVVDVETGDGYFALVPYSLSEYKGGTLCCYAGYVRSLHRRGSLPNQATRSFSVYGLRWGKSGKKYLERLVIEGEGRLELEICGNGKRQAFVVQMTGGVAEFPVKMRAQAFDLHLKLSDDTKVRAITMQSCRLHGLR